MTPGISFLTAFLTLVKGPQPVELAVQGPVATVEIRLDNREVATLSRPPWKTTCDLGATIAPHRLEAVARASDGTIVARDEQLVNVRQTRAQAQLMIHSDSDGTPTGGQLHWNHALQATPSRITVAVDDRMLELDEDARFILDGTSRSSTRIVSAELEFPTRRPRGRRSPSVMTCRDPCSPVSLPCRSFSRSDAPDSSPPTSEA
jgi:hypothetical protein